MTSAASAPASDRDSWCTERWIAEAVGPWDLDPCSNERSHIRAERACWLARGEDGLDLAKHVPATWRVFINPPYSHVMPWVLAYRHTRFCFLLRLDPSTRWYEELAERTRLVLLPRRTRVQFEPPPGVKASSNPFPHALYYANPDDATRAIRRRCYAFAPARLRRRPEESKPREDQPSLLDWTP